MGGRKTLQFHFDNSYGLLPDRVAINGEERARISVTQWSGRAVYDFLVELRSGKQAVLDYLDTRPDLLLHKPWISAIKEPFYNNFPQITRLSII